MRQYLSTGWYFTEQFSEALFTCGNEVLTPVRIPHTCKETPFHYFDESIYQMVSGYRFALFAPEDWRGKKVLLTFEGVGHDSTLYLNGEKVMAHHCGYTAFTADLSDILNYGVDNQIVVRVDSREELNIPPFGFVMDYMTYGGIYRDVYVDVKESTCLEDVFLKSECVSFAQGKANLVAEIQASGDLSDLMVSQSISIDGQERNLGTLAYQGRKMILKWKLGDVKFWDTEHPHLYKVTTRLLRGDKVLDERVIAVGFRQAEFRKDGFYLNGKKLKLRGLNRHQSYAYVGYAMPESMQKLDADILKYELGLNAVRTSHYPQSHYFLDRCDEIGLLVFTEIPGWQHIGDEPWKDQAVENVRDMVLQYRNHTSIILWGVRINESRDDDEFYLRTNDLAHMLDDSRPTGGVRALKKSSMLEDVYTYNDFSHDGKLPGCEAKGKVTPDVEKAYMITEYNGHMYPTKAFDWEEHRAQHALRHANVLDAVASHDDIAGSFGWCMFDYNTHKDFGSGDRICYHGVMDMFRNPKLAAAVYASQQDQTPVLEISSSMDIGEHPGCNRGETYIFSNADSVKMYKNDVLIKEYTSAEATHRHLCHSPMTIDDYIGDSLKAERYPEKQEAEIKQVLNMVAKVGINRLPAREKALAAKLMLVNHMTMSDATELYNNYVGDWGGEATVYRFDAIKDGKVVKSVTKAPMHEIHLHVRADHTLLKETHTYDVASIRIQAQDEHGNLLNFCNDPVIFEVEGPVEIIGPRITALQGGMGGTYIKTLGTAGPAKLKISGMQTETVEIGFEVRV